MLKFFIIVFLIGFLVFKVIGLFFRVLVGGSANGRSGQRSYQNNSNFDSRKAPDGNINIDFVPNNKTREKVKDFKGGEYVEYEEID